MLVSVFSFVWLLFGVLAGTILAEGDDLDNSISLNSKNFDDSIEANNYFIMFYAPWCGHCKRLKPTWNDFAKEVNTEEGSGSETKIAAVDCTLDSALCSTHGVKGYPTLLFFVKGSKEGVKYSKGRDVASFKKFLQQKLDPNYAEPEVKIEPCAVPPVEKGLFELQDCNFDAAIKTGLAFVKFYAPWCGHCKKLAPAWAELAEKLESVENVRIVKLDCTTQKAACEKYEVGGFPTLVLFKDGKVVDKYRGGRDLQTLTKYLDNKVNGTAEEKPADSLFDCSKPKKDEIGVWEVQDCHFNYHINVADAFVKFYAPWCGHCKKLAPAWEKLAEHYQSLDTVRVTKLDCTKNDKSCNAHEVSGYPTLMYFRKGKLVATYSGQRDYDNLLAFVEEQLKTIDVPERIIRGEKAPAGVRIVEAMATVEELSEAKAKGPVLVIFFHASNEKHAKEHAVFVDSKDRVAPSLQISDVDCGMAEKLCKQEKAFSDDETFIHFYNGGNVFKHDSGPKTTESIRSFIKTSYKQMIDQAKQKVKKDEL